MMKRIFFNFLILSMSLVNQAWAADWPERTIRIVVAYPAGGGVDAVARIYGSALTRILGQQVMVENRPGASGAIGAQDVIRSAPDGYTILMASPAEVMVNAIAGQKLPYDSQKALVPVALAGETPLAIVAHPASVAAKNLNELVALAKDKNLQLNYGTPGGGSTMNFAGEALRIGAGINWQHIPYKGAAPAVNDVLGGQVQIVISGLPPLLQHIKTGKLTALAITSDKRSAVLPDVMTVAELAGMSNFRFTNWMGVFAPVGTSPKIVERLGLAFEKASKEPKIKDSLAAVGVDPRGLQGEEFAKFLDEERSRYQDIASKTDLSSP